MAGRTYRYLTEDPLYPFGFGLSFTTFAYGPVQLSRRAVGPGEGTTARVVVTNGGRVAAEDVVQLYVSGPRASARAPRAALKGFRRVRLGPGEARTVELAVEPSMLALVDDAGRERAEKGEFRLTIGGASPGPRAVALGAPEPAQAVVTVR